MQRIVDQKELGRIQHTARLLMNVMANKAKKSQQDGLDLKVVVWGASVRFIACLLDAAPKAGIQTTTGDIVADFAKDVSKQMEILKEMNK